MRNKLSAILAGLACLYICIFLVWTFSLHGVRGFLQVEKTFWVAVILFVLLGIVPPALNFSGWFKRGIHKIRTSLSIIVIIISSISIVISIIGFLYISGFPYPHVTGVPRLVMVAGSGPNGIPDVAVITESRQPSQYTLAWGTPGTTFIIKEEGNTTTHIFMLCSLEPDTDYWYRVNDGPVYHFSTPAASVQLHFAVGSDAHFGASDNRPYLTAQMLAQIADPANDFGYFFSLGDLVEYGFRVEQWQEALATLSPVTTSIPAGFVAGNHDALFTGVDRFREYCFPVGVESQSRTPLWYRFDVGNVHFLVLDLEWSVETFNKEQEDWLESELNSIPADDWTIVLSHGYYFASGSVQDGWPWYDNPEAIRRITPIFERYDVDLVFSGHVHQMELLEKAGVTYVIVGSFGGIPDPERTYISPASLWYVSGQYGFVDVTIETGRALITFRDPSGGVLKTAVVDK